MSAQPPTNADQQTVATYNGDEHEGVKQCCACPTAAPADEMCLEVIQSLPDELQASAEGPLQPGVDPVAGEESSEDATEWYCPSCMAARNERNRKRQTGQLTNAMQDVARKEGDVLATVPETIPDT